MFLYNLKALAGEKLHIVFDLDFTIISKVYEKQNHNTFLASDKNYYNPNKWALEGIEIAYNEGHKISFFSGGDKKRNESVLKKLRLTDGRTLYEIATNIHSKSDLVVKSKMGKFSERYKKDLGRLGYDLKNTILIDDILNFVPVSQKDNILWLGRSYEYFNDYNAVLNKGSSSVYQLKYVPQSYEKWFISHNKLRYIFELLLDSSNSADPLSYIARNRQKYIPDDSHGLSTFQQSLLKTDVGAHLCFRKYRLFLPK